MARGNAAVEDLDLPGLLDGIVRGRWPLPRR